MSANSCGERLPLELMRVVLSYLNVTDLCRCACVCNSWNELVKSLDKTTWKFWYKRNLEWRLPLWPMSQDEEAISWQRAYRENYIASKIWAIGGGNSEKTNCLLVFRRKRERRTLHVGAGLEYTTLKSALAVANDYDRILIHPGTYDEQFEMSSKIPFELVGAGELGSVILVMCIEQNALTGRLCNLTLRAPWFTQYILKVRTGHVQVDTCTFEDGQILVQGPATCHIKHTTFKHAFITMQQVNVSIIEKCDFIKCEPAAVIVEGHPKEDSNWIYLRLAKLARKFDKPILDHDNYSMHRNAQSNDGATPNRHDADDEDSDGTDGNHVDEPNQSSVSLQSRALSHSNSAQNYDIPPDDDFTIDSSSDDDDNDEADDNIPNNNVLDLDYLDSFDTDSSDMSDTFDHTDSDSDSSSNYEDDRSVLQLSNPNRHKLLHATSINTFQNDIQSLHHKAVTLNSDLLQDTAVINMLENILGCVMRNCRVSHGKGGVMVANQAQAVLMANEFCDLQYGVRCIQNSKTVLWKNNIHHCKTSGVFMRLAARGLIATNDIHHNIEAGIDIRKNADPLVQCNRIHHGKRSGIVVLGSGRGIIKGNNIFENKEAAIYILYRGNPIICGNRIWRGKAAGIAINENGRGHIIDNLIGNNQWGGIDIRHGSDPLITNNLICNGIADGIVVGEGGKGSIRNNIIHANAGCGIWVMSGLQPCIHGNQISSNGDSGIAFVNTRDLHHGASRTNDIDGQSAQSAELQLFSETTAEDDDGRASFGEATVEYNSIYHNSASGVFLQSKESIHIMANVIHGNREIGIQVHQVAPVLLINNSVTCNAGSGIEVAEFASVDIHGNGIYDNRDEGILLQSEGEIWENDIIGNQRAGILVHNAKDVKISNNRIHSSDDPCINLTGFTQPVIENNILYKGRSEPIAQTSEAGGQLSQNSILPIPVPDKGLNADKTSSIPGTPNWKLENPAPRPHIKAPPALSIAPAHRVTTVTKVKNPAGGTCQHEGSKTCIIL
ncbi:unnamed protein product [Owenia fusiformis]|uniref:Uncharacterized protein n=1 Tax=Owenia fusiformis TaxID=6347 RepID=A0A8J1XZB4_OWEFU|nr:unnamed protein product [Owenia fusiformis]